MTLDLLVMGIAGFGWEALGDRVGPRPVVLAGATLVGIGLLTTSQAKTPLAFQLTYGGIVGFGLDPTKPQLLSGDIDEGA